MANRICDRDPCFFLGKALQILLARDATQHFEMIVASSRVGTSMRVFVEYCPFCGTRIEPEWIADAVKKRR